MRRFAAVAPAGGRSFAAGFCAEGLFSPGVLRRKIFAADGSRGGSCGFRSYRLSKSGACVGRFASTLPHGTAPPRTSCVPGCVFRIRCPEVRASGRVYRRPCGAACVPRTGSEDRLSAASVRRRNAAERTFPFRCGEGSQYDTGDCGDAAHRTGGCPQRSDPVRRRGGAFRGRSDGAKEGPIAIGAVGAWGLPVVARCRPGEVCEQTDSRTEWRQNSRSEGQKAGFVRETEKCGRGTELRRERAGPTCGFGKRRGGEDGRPSPPPPDRKNGAETNMGPGGWRMVLK